MSTESSQDVRAGCYIDYSRRWGWQTQRLCSKYSATLWTNFLGIVVTIALARGFRLLLKARDSTNVLGGVREGERARTAPEAIAFHKLSEMIQSWREGRIQLDGPNGPQNRPPVARTVLLAVLLIATFAGFLTCGVVTAYLATDSKALSSSSRCGLYVPAPNGSQVEHAMGPFAFQAQLDSSQLAENCYDKASGADGCNFFVQQSIPYTHSDVACPFPDGMCHENMSSASHFSTGPIDAAAVGVHAPQTFEFQRNTTCVPLNGNETYISTTGTNGTYTHTYNYGSSNGLPFTWQTTTHDSNLEWQPYYLVNTVMSGPAYDPIPALRPPKGSTLTLIFIHPQKISYLVPSDDPIFPAHTEFYIDSSDKPRWRYMGPHASVLACVDTTLWRDPSTGSNWQPYLPEPSFVIEDSHTRGGFLFMVYTLLWSNIYDTINYRLGGGLAAQKLVHGWESLPLAKEQWKVEAKQLFETSLARIQIDARNIAQGTAASYPGLQRLEVESAVCDGTFLFMSQGWQNVNVTGSIWIGVLAVIFVVLAMPLYDGRLFVQWLWVFATKTVPRFLLITIPRFLTKKIMTVSRKIYGYWERTTQAVRRLFA